MCFNGVVWVHGVEKTTLLSQSGNGGVSRVHGAGKTTQTLTPTKKLTDFGVPSIDSYPSPRSMSIVSNSTDEEVLSPETDVEMANNRPPVSKQAILSYLKTICTRKSERESFRFCATSLFSECAKEGNKRGLEILSKESKVIESMLKPLCDAFYDTFIVQNVLGIIQLLLENYGQKIEKPENLRKDIKELKRIWESGVNREVGVGMKLRIAKSQTCVRACERCLEVM